MRAHPRLGLPAVRRAGQDTAGRAVPGRLAPRSRAGHRAGRADRACSAGGSSSAPDVQAERDHAEPAGQDTADLDAVIRELDEEITGAGMRGNVLPARPARRHRSTRRRQDAPDLPRRKIDPRTVGKTYTAPDGKTFRPSLFVTLTCPSYGRVNSDGTPADPDGYDYRRAARDALHFAALFDRFMQNLRRLRRPRRAVLRRRRATTAARPAYPYRPARHPGPSRAAPGARRHLPPGVVARHHHRPLRRRSPARLGRAHPGTTSTLRPGKSCPPGTTRSTPSARRTSRCTSPGSVPRFDAQGVLAGSKDAARCIGYLVKYLTKHVADCHQADTDAQRAHAERLADALRYEPCSPACANWLRYGVQPKNSRPGMRPGACKGKAHRREHLGYAGRRVLVSRKWSGKTLADHRADRKDWLMETLGHSGNRPGPVRLGTRHPRPTPTTCRPPGGCCTSSPTASPGNRHSTRPDAKRPGWVRRIFRQRGGPRDGQPPNSADRLLTVEAAAERMSTSARFVRRLIAERRIEFVKIGRHVRISESALAEFIESGRTPPDDGRRCVAQDEESRDGEQGRAPTFRQYPQAAVWPVSDPVPGTGRPVADRRRHLREQDISGQSSVARRGTDDVGGMDRSSAEQDHAPGVRGEVDHAASEPSTADGRAVRLAPGEAHRAAPRPGAHQERSRRR